MYTYANWFRDSQHGPPFLHRHVRSGRLSRPEDRARVFRWNLNVNVKKPARIPRCRWMEEWRYCEDGEKMGNHQPDQPPPVIKHQVVSSSIKLLPPGFPDGVPSGPLSQAFQCVRSFSTSGFSSWESTNWSYQERSGKLTFQAPIWMYVFWGGTRKSLRKNGEKVRKPSGFRAWKDGNWSHYMVASQGTNSLHLASPLSNTSYSPTKPSSNDHII